MAFTDQGKTVMLNALRSAITHVSLHSASPASTANELVGGGYARQPVEFSTPSSGAITLTNQPVFSVPEGATVACIGFCSAATGGTIYANATVDTEVYANPGTYTLESASLDLNK